ncbi:MAG: c-type cytochrome [Sphingobacteriales bacterium]|nr:MAG: c-type cytochrome [Sphingobacteriales bacterium]
MVKDPADMIANDPEAKKLFEEYKTPMLPLGLTDAEIDDVYAYLKQNDAQ